MQLSVGDFRLRFPLDVELRDVLMKQQGDTMISVGHGNLAVSVLPLFKGVVNVSDIDVDSVIYKMGTPDSSMYIRALVDNASLRDAAVSLSGSLVDVDRLNVKGARVRLAIQNDSTPVDTTASVPVDWRVRVKEITFDSIGYSMVMLPSIDSLGAMIPSARINELSLDLKNSSVDVRSFFTDSISATYLTPSPEYLASHPEVVTSPSDSLTVLDSKPWTVRVDSIRLAGKSALYGVAGATPLPGLDMNYISLSDIMIAVDSFYNRGVEIRVPLSRLSAHERCGIDLQADGLFEMDSVAMKVKGFHIGTLYSSLYVDAMMGMGDISSPSTPLALKVSGYIAPEDIALAFPSLSALTVGLPADEVISTFVDIRGTMGDLAVNQIKAEIRHCIMMEMYGHVFDVMNFDEISGRIYINGRVSNGRFIRPTLVQARLDKQVNLPPLTLNGNILLSRGTVNGSLRASTSGGKIALDAMWKGTAEKYRINLSTDEFPVDAFMPRLGVGKVNAVVEVDGTGYDPFNKKTTIDASLDLKKLTYVGKNYTDIKAGASLADGHAVVTASTSNPALDFTFSAQGNLTGDVYEWDMNGDIRRLDLWAIGLSDTTSSGSVTMNGHAVIETRQIGIDATLDVKKVAWTMPAGTISGDNISLMFNASDSTTAARLVNHDLSVDFISPTVMDSVLAHFTETSAFIDTVIANRMLNITRLQRVLPQFSLKINAGENNIVENYLNSSDIGFTNMSLNASNDSVINASIKVLNFNSGTTRLDTITFNAHQRSKFLPFDISIGNRRGTLDQWAHVNINGYAADDKAALMLNQQDITGRTGYRLGFKAEFSDTTVYLSVVPLAPIIGYKKWSVNKDNFIELNTVKKHFDADLIMKNSESSVHLYTNHEKGDSVQEDVILKISDVKIADWLVFNPFAPPVKGDLSADMSFGWTDRSLNGSGTIGLNDFYYGKERVGSFDLGVDLTTNAGGTVKASVALMVDSIKTITAIGNLNDSTAPNPFLLDFQMIRFPLSVVNPFLPPNMLKLSGVLNGTMDITGSIAAPVFNGYLDFDSTAIRIPMLGTDYTFSDDRIPVDSNIVKFSDFTIKGVNDNPLAINGTVDLKKLSEMRVDLIMKARNMQIVGSNRGKGVEVYGKAFVDIDADVKGDMNGLNVDAALDLLPGTNVTYVMTDATSALESRSIGDMVTFVNFADTAAIKVDTIPETPFSINLDALLTISEGSTINVDLSTDGKNRVTILGSGSLNYTMNQMNDSRFSGRFNINGGFARYSPPFMSEKLFNFQEGSYVAFNGNMLNPILNIHAVDNLRANVTQEGQNSRLITFDVGLSVTNTLDNMDIAFDLSTSDDITVENELRSMTAEQRATQAMNLLLYNVYSGPGTRASANIGANPLFAFLESQLNSWAANNIKGVDISFGINQYDRTVDGASTSTTSYSYRVSKSLFNDRFKIVVGGNYTTDSDPDENLSQNLINDISFEYLLNKSGSMFIKLFRHTGYESILEGEITQTGVGFVYKRKLRKLIDLFKPFTSRSNASIEPPSQGAVINPTTTAEKDETDKK